MKIQTILTYKGYEDYKPKNKDITVKLHHFANAEGEIYKCKMPDDFSCTINARCRCDFKYGSSKKSGEWKEYFFMTDCQEVKANIKEQKG